MFKWVEDKTHLDKIGGITLSMTELISAMICFIGIFSPVVTWILPDKYAPVQFLLLSCMLYPLFYTLTEVSGIGLNVVKRTWLITAVNIVALPSISVCCRYWFPIGGAWCGHSERNIVLGVLRHQNRIFI